MRGEVTPESMLTLRKTLTKYDGNCSYDVHRRAFADLVSQFPQLTDKHKFELLYSSLQGDARTVLEDLNENRTFEALDDALRVAYSRPVHPWTELRNLSTLKQATDETLEAWATRVTRPTDCANCEVVDRLKMTPSIAGQDERLYLGTLYSRLSTCQYCC
jgi:hypothetical protein